MSSFSLNLNLIMNFFDKKPIKFEKLYTATQHNGCAKVFHEKCDHKGPTLTIIESDKGFIFGGFTQKQWGNNNARNQPDPASFLFSINSKQKFNAKNVDGIYSSPSYGPHFYGTNYKQDFIFNINHEADDNLHLSNKMRAPFHSTKGNK